ncbi:MAG: asparaginase [Anaerolineales bacterium]|nr:asparaginase [Anaerolineales bacterium]
MAGSAHIPLVEVTRGNIVESVHYGSCAVVLPDGTSLFSLGDATTPFFLRSSTKPFQTLAFLEQGGTGAYNLTLEEIAIITSSHSGTARHLAVLEKLQQKIGIKQEMLQCGTHLPIDIESAKQLLKDGQPLMPNHNNCSGKHTGKLAFAMMIGAAIEDYLNPSHPVEQIILATFAQMCGIEPESVEVGIDGCTAPVFAVPLPAAALAFARLCQPDGLSEDRKGACRKVTEAMSAHPFMIAGPGRFDTDVMSAAGGSIVSKIGAEGFQGIGVLPGRTSGIDRGIGIVFKVSDGDLSDHRASGVIALAILKALGALDANQTQALQTHDRRPVTNWRGLPVGEIRPSRQLEEALRQI